MPKTAHCRHGSGVNRQAHLSLMETVQTNSLELRCSVQASHHLLHLGRYRHLLVVLAAISIAQSHANLGAADMVESTERPDRPEPSKAQPSHLVGTGEIVMSAEQAPLRAFTLPSVDDELEGERAIEEGCSLCVGGLAS